MTRPGDPRTPLDDIGRLQVQLRDMLRRLGDLEAPSGSAANQNVKKLTDLVTDIQAQLDDYIANGTYNKQQINDLLAGKANTAHTHSANDITTGGVTGSGFGVGGPLTVQGDITGGGRGIFPTGIRSSGARNTQVTNDYVVAYLNSDGTLGYAPSTLASKDVLGPYAVDMAKFLAIDLYAYTYKTDPKKSVRMGPIADYLDAAGLKEFVIYDPDDASKIQGLRFDMLIYGLWSAYVQSRTTTLARIAKQLYQTKTVSGMTSLGLNAERTYDIVWDTAFADTSYLVSASVSSSGAALAAVASIVPGSQTATGCKVSVRTLGLALAAGATLTVQGVHV